MTCQANNRFGHDCYIPTSVTVLNKYVGNWYDTKGNLVLTIGGDYSVNRCKILSILSAFPESGPYRVEILENGRSKYIDLEYLGSHNNNWEEDVTGYHSYLVMNGQTELRRTKNPQYFESVGGIYLGMSKDEVLRLYGQPSKFSKGYRSTWEYNKEGMSLFFDGNIVIAITMYPKGNRRFDWSGLSANSSVNDFYYKYNPTKIKIDRSSGLDIGYGEVIFIYNGEVTLGLKMSLNG